MHYQFITEQVLVVIVKYVPYGKNYFLILPKAHL